MNAFFAANTSELSVDRIVSFGNPLYAEHLIERSLTQSERRVASVVQDREHTVTAAAVLARALANLGLQKKRSASNRRPR